MQDENSLIHFKKNQQSNRIQFAISGSKITKKNIFHDKISLKSFDVLNATRNAYSFAIFAAHKYIVLMFE